MRVVGRLCVAVCLVVPLALAVAAWRDVSARSVEIIRTNDVVRSVLWQATLTADGALAVEARYALRGDDPVELDLMLPEGAAHVRLDGAAVGLGPSRRPELGPPGVGPTVRGSFTLAYDLPDVGTLYADGGVVETEVLASLISMSGFEDIELQGALWFEGGGEARVWLSDVRGAAVAGPGLVRFGGATGAWDEPRMVALVPAAALSSRPSRDGSARARVDALVAEESARLAELRDEPRARAVAAAVALSVASVLALVWAARRALRVARRRVAAVRGVPSVLTERPSSLDVAVVGVVMADRLGPERSVVAATLLHLAADGLVQVEGLDAERFELVIPAGVEGRSTFERRILRALRPQGQAGAEVRLSGPPLWSGPQAWLRHFTADAVSAARKHRLLERTFSGLVLVPMLAVAGLLGIVGAGRPSPLAVFALAAAVPVGLLAAALGGVTLTRAGARVRTEWLAWGRHLYEDLELAEVGVPGVVVWGPYLADAAFLGAAPVASRALAPRR